MDQYQIGYSGYDSRPLYNSADASLLLFEATKKFLNYTSDYEWIRDNIYIHLVKIMNAYQKKIDIDGNNIFMDNDYLISSGTENIQNTWMDAKIRDFVVTPRNGKAVEINSMWYNALKIMEELTILLRGKEEAKRYSYLANKCKDSFNSKFYNKEKKCLYDVLGDSKIRPNQLFALSLSYPVVDPNSEEAKESLNTVERELLTQYGLRTLARGEEGFTEKYDGDMVKRDMSYHQGVIWPWLLGQYYDTLKNMIKSAKNNKEKKTLEDKLEKFRINVKNTFWNEMTRGRTVGNISEIYSVDNEKYIAEGTFAQAWSIAEIFRIIVQEDKKYKLRT